MAVNRSAKVFTNLKLGNSSKVEVKGPEDKQDPYITGCVFTPVGEVVLSDSQNHKIKVLDARQFTVKDTIHLQSRPWDVSVVDDSSVVVTLPDKPELQFLKVSPQLEKGRVIHLEKRCWGVEVVSQKIYLTAHDGMTEGHVVILDMDGNMLRRLGVSSDESYMFKSPFYLTVRPSSSSVYVSDSFKPSLTCLLPDGKVQYEYRDPEISGDRGICVDREGNIMLCGQASDKVQIVTPGGKKHSTLLSNIDSPTVVALNGNQDTLIVGCYGRLLVFKIK